MRCSNCGAEIPEGHDSCVQCFTQVRKPRSLLARFLAWFFRSGLAPQMIFPNATVVRRVEHIEFTDAATGQRRVFDSLDDVPPDVRAKIDAICADHQDAVVHETITFRELSGIEHTYRSADELPPEVRAIYEHLFQSPHES